MKQMKDRESLKLLAKETLSPLAPIPTEIASELTALSDISAVIFDIYGTLLVSGTGDVGVSSQLLAAFGLEDLLEQSGFTPTFRETGDRIPRLLQHFILEHHDRSRNAGVDYPEVDIRNIWKLVLEQLWSDGLLAKEPHNRSVEELALRYEILVNPVWMMPGFPGIVESLSQSGYRIGIVSNAQFYTPIIIEALTGRTLEQLCFDMDLCSWSYQKGCAKPSPVMFKEPLEQLQQQGINPGEVLYVGNDKLNDIAVASEAGCRTALFAGDSRSLRLRESDPRANTDPTVIITELSQLKAILK